MYIYRNIPFEVIWRFGWKNIFIFLCYSALLCLLHHELLVSRNFHMHIPFNLIGPIGVAVAIYASFKNGQAYDRMWEARKNWGALAVSTRIFANQLMMYLPEGSNAVIRQMIDRQIAYLQALKLQLRRKAPHSRSFSRSIRKYYFGEPAAADWELEVYRRLPHEESESIRSCSNQALQILYLQNKHIRHLKDQHMMDEFRMVEMMQNLSACFENQGKNERLKSTPFPRQYAFFSRYFIQIFIFILPFGILELYDHYTVSGYAVICILYALIAWLYITIELVGDFSEDPFENFVTDIPMSTIIRNVEIDLLELIKAPVIPGKLEAKHGFSM